MQLEQLKQKAREARLSPVDACVQFVRPRVPPEAYKKYCRKIGVPENSEIWTLKELQTFVHAIPKQSWREGKPRDFLGPNRSRYLQLLTDRQWNACWELYESIIEKEEGATLTPDEYGHILGIALSQKQAMMEVFQQEEHELVIHEMVVYFASLISSAILEKELGWSIIDQIRKELLIEFDTLEDASALDVDTRPENQEHELPKRLRKEIETMISDAMKT